MRPIVETPKPIYKALSATGFLQSFDEVELNMAFDAVATAEEIPPECPAHLFAPAPAQAEDPNRPLFQVAYDDMLAAAGNYKGECPGGTPPEYACRYCTGVQRRARRGPARRHRAGSRTVVHVGATGEFRQGAEGVQVLADAGTGTSQEVEVVVVRCVGGMETYWEGAHGVTVSSYIVLYTIHPGL